MWHRRAGSALTVGVLLAAAVAVTPARAATGGALVRVNQLGYATGSQAKRAYLMTSGAETGATFMVKDAGGTTVYSAPIGANLGSWSSAYPDVYALDFPSVVSVGTYTVAVA